jgi:hypothetical protein
MLLYRFRPFNQHTITELLTQKLHFSHPSTWNDPLEEGAFRPKLDSEMRYACFATNKNEKAQNIEEKDMLQNILMWSHYAESHKGICIEYEYSITGNHDLLPIKYLTKSEINDDKLRYGLPEWKQDFWSYESEYRMLAAPGLETNLNYKGINIPYSEIALKIKAIYCGVNFTELETLKIIRGNRDFEIFTGTVENYASIKFEETPQPKTP